MSDAFAPGWAVLVRARNPGPMTLDGTNSWILRAPGADGCVIIDPGPDEVEHLAALAERAPVEAIVVTHGHPDHTDGVDGLVGALGGRVPVIAGTERWARAASVVSDGDVRHLGGLDITFVMTPGHTSDSMCLVAADADGGRAIFTGDTILGRGTTVVAWPDGDLGDYLRSLDVLAGYVGVPVMPGHGPVLPDCGVIAAEYRAHRQDRLTQVRAALAGGARTPSEVVGAVYPDLDPVLVPAAEWTVRAALAYLERA